MDGDEVDTVTWLVGKTSNVVTAERVKLRTVRSQGCGCAGLRTNIASGSQIVAGPHRKTQVVWLLGNWHFKQVRLRCPRFVELA